MTTLADVAAAAGVSMMTVSNVIAGKRNKVSAATAARVEEAIAETGYVLNASARALSGRRSHIIAIVVNSEGDVLRSTHDARYLGELAKALLAKGYYSMLLPALDLAQTARSLRSWNADGAIFINTMAHQIDELRDVHDVPMLFSDNYAEASETLTVRTDDHGGGRLAAEHLIEKGHRRAMFVGPLRHRLGVVDERYRGFREAFEGRGLPTPAAPELVTSTEMTAGIAAGRSIAQGADVPTAIFCSADELAAGVLQGLGQSGLDVPGDVSIIGFDGFDIGQVTVPELTTIAQDITLKATRSVDLLLARLEGRPRAENPPLPLALVERGSVSRRSES